MSPYLFIALVCLALSALVARSWFKSYLSFAGDRVVTCPETGQPAGVRLAAFSCAAREVVGEHAPKVGACSRWPERAGCGQECLARIEAAPDGCRVREIVAAWYEGKSCARCGKDLSPAMWPHNRPAVRAPDGHTFTWAAVAPQDVPATLTTHTPVCWDCHIHIELVRNFPGRAVVRDKHGMDAAYHE